MTDSEHFDDTSQLEQLRNTIALQHDEIQQLKAVIKQKNEYIEDLEAFRTVGSKQSNAARGIRGLIQHYEVLSRMNQDSANSALVTSTTNTTTTTNINSNTTSTAMATDTAKNDVTIGTAPQSTHNGICPAGDPTMSSADGDQARDPRGSNSDASCLCGETSKDALEKEVKALRAELLLMSRAWHSLARRTVQTARPKTQAQRDPGWLTRQQRALEES